MKRWRFIDPGPNMEPVETVMSEDEIIATYFPFWSERMRKVGKEALISRQNCIDDWVTVHWASPVTDEV